MAVVGSAEVLVTPSFRGMQKAVSGATASMSKQMGSAGPTVGQRIVGGLGSALKSGVGAVGVAAGAGLGYALIKGFGRLKAIDQANAKLTGLGHSTGEVKNIMDDALKSVKGTAFGLDEAATVAASATAAGIKPGKELQKTLTLVADAATIGGTSLGDMGAIFNKVAASNKLQGDTINQLNDKGIPILQFLGKTMHKSQAEVSELASKGKIDFKTFQTAMEQGLGGAAQSSGKTFTGAMANIKASLGRIGAGLLGGVFPQLAPLLTKITKAMGPLEDAAAGAGEAIGKKFAGAVTVLGGLIDKVTAAVGSGGLRKAFEGLGSVIGPATGALVALGSAGFAPLLKMVPGLGGLGGVFAKLGGPIGILVSAILGLVATSPELRGAFLDVFQQIGATMSTVGPQLSEIGKTVLTTLATSLSQVAAALGGSLSAVLPAVGSAFGALATVVLSLAPAVNVLLPVLTSIVVAMINLVTPVLSSKTAVFGLVGAFIAFKAVQTARGIIEGVTTAMKLQTLAAGASTTAVKVHAAAMKLQVFWYKAWALGSKVAAGAAKVFAAGQWLLNAAMSANPIGIVVVAIGALVAAFIIAYKKSATFRKIVQAALDGVRRAAGAVADFFTDHIIPVFKRVGDFLKDTFGPAVKTAGDILGKLFTGDIGGAAQTFGSTLSGAFRKAGDGAKDLAGTLVDKGGDMLGGLMKGVNDKLPDLTEWFEKLPDRIKKAVGDATDWLTDKGKHAITGIVKGAAQAGPAIAKWFIELPGKIKSWVGNAGDWLKQNGSQIIHGLVKGIKIAVPVLLAVFIGLPLLIIAALIGAAAVLVYAGGVLIANLVKGITQAIGKKVGPALDGVKKKFNDLKGWAGSTWRKGWAKVSDWIGGAVDGGRKKAASALTTTQNKFSSLKNWAGTSWRKAWGAVKGWIGSAVEGGRDQGGKALTNLQDKFSKLKSWAGGAWRKAWSGVKGWISDSVAGGRDRGKSALQGLQDRMGALKDWGRSSFKKAWSGVKGWISDPVGSAKNAVNNHKERIKAIFNALDEFGRKIFGKRWAGIKETLSKPIRVAVDYLGRLFGRGGRARTLFTGWLEAVKGIFGRLKGAVATPIRAVISAINAGLIKGGINWILTKLGVKKDKQVPWIPVPKFATGGPIRGRGGKRADKNLIAASAGEFMQPANAVDYYGESTMEAIRKRKIPKEAFANIERTGAVDPHHAGGGLAAGGLVSVQGGRFSEKFAKVVVALSKAVPGFQMYQGGWNAGGVAASGGTHDKDAIDYGPANRTSETVGRSLGMAAWLRNAALGWTQTMPHVHAVPSPAIGDGSSGARTQWQNYLDGDDGLVGNRRDTGTRKYVKGGKGIIGSIGAALSGALDFLKGLDPIDWLKKKVTGLAGKDVGGGAFGKGLIGTVPGMIVDKGKDWITEKIGALADAAGGVAASWSGGAVGGWNGEQLNNAATIVSTAKSLGMGEKGALIGLITAMQESTLRNLSGGDRDSVGLFQQRAPWGPFSARHNPAQAAGMFYQGGQGGQPGLKSKNWRAMAPGAAAQAVQVSAFPGAYTKWIGDAQKILGKYKFDDGGYLQPGITAVNKTGKPEPVLTNGQWDNVATLVDRIDQLITEERKPRDLMISSGKLTFGRDGELYLRGVAREVVNETVARANRRNI